MSNENIDFKKILNDSRDTLLNPKAYFSSMPLTGGYAEPVIKAAIYGTIAGLIALLWGVLGLSSVGAGVLGGTLGIVSLIYSIIGAVIGLFISGAIILIISAICGGNTDYEANVRVAAAFMVIFPIRAVFAFSYSFSLTLGGIIAFLISLYGIYMLYHAVIQALKGKEPVMKIVAIVLVVLSLLSFFRARSLTSTFSGYSDLIVQEQVD